MQRGAVFRRPASGAEEHAYDRLVASSYKSFGNGRRTGQLIFRSVLEKGLFSSPAACLKTIAQRLHTLASKTTP